MKYFLNQLSDPKRFQNLISAILVARYGENARVTPIQGKDGASDGETAPQNPFMEFECGESGIDTHSPLMERPRQGRYIFQVKYHQTGEHRLSDLRSKVVQEFKKSLQNDVLERTDRKNVNYFFLVTNISSSKDSIQKIDDIRRNLLAESPHLHADVWWSEAISTFLDWSPNLWNAYPELFAGGTVPLLARTVQPDTEGLSNTLHLAVTHQYERDCIVKFTQIELNKHILDLFVDLDIRYVGELVESPNLVLGRVLEHTHQDLVEFDHGLFRSNRKPTSALRLLIDDEFAIPRILLEGGPGQGKSTITQMAVQIYREKILSRYECNTRDQDWHLLSRLRIPIRIEFKDFAAWINQERNVGGSLEQYIANVLSHDSGGVPVTVQDVQTICRRSSLILFLDGLDEIGNDTLRDQVLDSTIETIIRFEMSLQTDIRVVLTTRPPAVQGHREKLEGFVSLMLAPMEHHQINEYLDRWLKVQISSRKERNLIQTTFNSRRQDSHVEALARNPMQLSVLLHLIKLKRAAFPNHRAELYRDYFQIVIDRDIDKSPELSEKRNLVEGLHSYLGFQLQGNAEVEQGRRAFSRVEIVELSGQWLEREGFSKDLAEEYFALGEVRFGLIVAVTGEGHDSTYGFEVQPIQEYFAAAYISDRLPDGQAHEVFESLISRDYWREVALFLAGLRRPNEKADLVVRAKNADRLESKNIRQNGRLIILQLLEEGVLTQSRPVQSEAMNFVMELLDPAILRLQRFPDSVVHDLSTLAKNYRSAETQNAIFHTATKLSHSNDLTLISLVHRIAANVLPQDQYKQLILGYSNESSESRALVRISCPFNVPEVFSELGSDPKYWTNITPSIFARRFWSAVIHTSIVPDVTYPVGAHSELILQFAIGRWPTRRAQHRTITVYGTSVPAIWKLLFNVQVIQSCRVDKQGNTITNSSNSSFELCWTDGGLEPLDTVIESCLHELIVVTDTVTACIEDSTKSSVNSSLLACLASMTNLLTMPGLVGWIATRCACKILQSRLFSNSEVRNSEIFRNLLNALTEQYAPRSSKLPKRLYFLDLLAFEALHKFRMEPDSELLPLHKVLSNLVLNDFPPKYRCQFDWLWRIPIPTKVIKLLVESCRHEMERVLSLLGISRMAGAGHILLHHRLQVQDTQRILKICRQTNDPQVLRGAATTLVLAKYSRLLDPDLLLKILTAAPTSALVTQVFDVSDRSLFGRHDPQLSALAQQVARRIFEEPDLYPFNVVNKAVELLVEIDGVRNKPLFTTYPDLQNFVITSSTSTTH